MKPKTENELRKIAANVMNKLREVEDKRRIKELRPLIGKCFRYRNSYGHGENWWLYIKVIGLKSTWLKVFFFEKTCYEEWKIKYDDIRSSMEGYEQISTEEFNQAWHECLTELNKLNK